MRRLSHEASRYAFPEGCPPADIRRPALVMKVMKTVIKTATKTLSQSTEKVPK
ncbi:hypothetical protein ACFO4O_12270 [Glaciecola siphonariae]|uniref:Uncharacterized protein n=1 Tax=Glaciecola siphonariae TaxID=521012 RepID=A0ABV9LXM4_9ALTE